MHKVRRVLFLMGSWLLVYFSGNHQIIFGWHCDHYCWICLHSFTNIKAFHLSRTDEEQLLNRLDSLDEENKEFTISALSGLKTKSKRLLSSISIYLTERAPEKLQQQAIAVLATMESP